MLFYGVQENVLGATETSHCRRDLFLMMPKKVNTVFLPACDFCSESWFTSVDSGYKAYLSSVVSNKETYNKKLCFVVVITDVRLNCRLVF